MRANEFKNDKVIWNPINCDNLLQRRVYAFDMQDELVVEGTLVKIDQSGQFPFKVDDGHGYLGYAHIIVKDATLLRPYKSAKEALHLLNTRITCTNSGDSYIVRGVTISGVILLNEIEVSFDVLLDKYVDADGDMLGVFEEQ